MSERRPPASGLSVPVELPADGLSLDAVMASIERSLVEQALRRTGGIQKRAAELLGCSFRSIRYLVAKYGIDKENPGALSR
jgi:two-component system response regulator PilR (NtrC family)